ncbi:unnamed protein product, partial [Meganyctiphanes norvegica]
MVKVTSRRRGSQCTAYGCNKRRKTIAEQIDNNRSDSDGSPDDISSSKKEHPRTFHKFPTDPVQRTKWIKNMHRQGWVPGISALICSDHFLETDLVRTTQFTRLTKDAIPTRFKEIPEHLKK